MSMKQPDATPDIVTFILARVFIAVLTVYPWRVWAILGPHVKRLGQATAPYIKRKPLAGLLGLMVILVLFMLGWRAVQDENAPYCSRAALQARRCMSGDWITVAGEEIPSHCDFNKKMHTVGELTFCH